MHNHVDDRQLRVETLPQGVIGTNSTDKPRWTIGRALRVLLLAKDLEDGRGHQAHLAVLTDEREICGLGRTGLRIFNL